jgi:hypothetical protein
VSGSSNETCDLVASSIRLLRVATQCPGMPEPMLTRGRDLLRSLLLRFTRPLMNLAGFECEDAQLPQAAPEPPPEPPPRAVTAIEVRQAPSSSLATASPRRPVSAFAKRKNTQF